MFYLSVCLSSSEWALRNTSIPAGPGAALQAATEPGPNAVGPTGSQTNLTSGSGCKRYTFPSRAVNGTTAGHHAGVIPNSLADCVNLFVMEAIEIDIQIFGPNLIKLVLGTNIYRSKTKNF